MRKISRRHKKNQEKTKKIVFSNLEQAITRLQETATAKFIETVELHANLNIDPKYSNQQLRSTVTLPHGIGKSIKIAVLTSEINSKQALNAGADIIGNNSLIQQISQGDIKFDLLIATPEMMPKLANLGRILGPKGLMPSPKAGTVTTKLIGTLKDFKRGKFEYKTDKLGIVHVSFGKTDFTNEQLVENLTFLSKSIKQETSDGILP